MICPFRLNVSYEYEETEKHYLTKGIKQEYAECYEEECPYYIYPGNCERTKGE